MIGYIVHNAGEVAYSSDSDLVPVHIILESFSSNIHHMIHQATAKFVFYAVKVNFKGMCRYVYVHFLWTKIPVWLSPIGNNSILNMVPISGNGPERGN